MINIFCWIIFIIWVINGPFLFMKINDVNNGYINSLKINLLIIISGPLLWLLKVFCFLKKTSLFIWKILNVILNKFYLWFGE